MAWEYIIYACGHSGREQLYGKVKDREWIAQRKAQGLCPECHKEVLERQHEEENRQAAENNKELGLPELVGTSKQVSWAETCRWKLVTIIQRVIDTAISSAPDDTVREKIADECILGFQHLCAETSASWWIDNQNMCSRMQVLQMIALHAQMARSEMAKAVGDTPINEEITIRPSQPKTESVAEIKISGKRVEITFRESREDFRDIIKKQLHFEWGGSCWVRDITSRTGTAQDRAAEAGHLLLAEGFIVRIADLAAREKAISGDFETEHTRWIQVRTAGEYTGWFAIVWDRWMDDDYYRPARAIPGAKWSKPCVVVPADQFEAVIDFASMYDFKFSTRAQALVESARQAKEQALLVDIKTPSRKRKVVIGDDIPMLPVPEEVSIDESLRDDN